MANSSSGRSFVALLRENCAQLGIQVRAYHGDWILTLKKGARTEHVFGYDFSLNSASSQQIAKDKAATYSILATAKVPAVEHQLVMSPTLPDYMPRSGNWEQLSCLFKRWNSDVVCKPNDGTGGRDVFRVRDIVQLERAIHTLLAKARSCAMSPYIEVQDEFRVLMLDGRNLLTYRKCRPSVTSDGQSKLMDLLADWLKACKPSDPAPDIKLKALGKLELNAHELNRVPTSGEVISINWRHNLGQGAAPDELLKNTTERKQLVQLARKAMNALRLRVASVDIVVLPNGKQQVLEVNSGIMMEQFAETARARAVDVYRQIVEAVFTNR
jgi:glutathione synthase/RimK-type ligase-like ATP-grasp enzyme